MDVLKGVTITAAIAGLLLLAGVTAALFTQVAPPTAPPAPPPAAREIVLVGMESGGSFVFALEGQQPTTPGPTIRVKVGELVKITFKNVGKVPHSFAILAEPEREAAVLFDASIGSAAQPLLPGEEASVLFSAERAGRFYYACTVPGHIELGMFGAFIVEK